MYQINQIWGVNLIHISAVTPSFTGITCLKRDEQTSETCQTTALYESKHIQSVRCSSVFQIWWEVYPLKQHNGD